MKFPINFPSHVTSAPAGRQADWFCWIGLTPASQLHVVDTLQSSSLCKSQVYLRLFFCVQLNNTRIIIFESHSSKLPLCFIISSSLASVTIAFCQLNNTRSIIWALQVCVPLRPICTRLTQGYIKCPHVGKAPSLPFPSPLTILSVYTSQQLMDISR